MGNFVEKSTLQAMILEILSKDKELLTDVFQALAQEYPQLIEDLTSTSTPMLVNEPLIAYKTIDKNIQKTELDDTEVRQLAKKQFEKYDAVFKALA
jgi:hypothetical protein